MLYACRNLKQRRRVGPRIHSNNNTEWEMEPTRRQGHRRSVKIFAVIALLFTFFESFSALSIVVDEEECIYEYVVHDGDTVSGNFIAVDHRLFWSSDHPGMDFTVTSPNGDEVYYLKGTSGDKFNFRAQKRGMYEFCFHNPHSTPETVSFYIHVGHIPNEPKVAKDEHLEPINVKIAELREALDSVTAEQKYLKAGNARHRHTNESTQRRVMLYTIGEYIFLALVSGLQVIFIRRLFGKSDAYNWV